VKLSLLVGSQFVRSQMAFDALGEFADTGETLAPPTAECNQNILTIDKGFVLQ